MSGLIPIEYDVDGVTYIRRHLYESGNGQLEMWFLCRPVLSMDSPLIGWSKEYTHHMFEKGITVAYWSGVDWSKDQPTPYKCPEDAYLAWKEWNENAIKQQRERMEF